MQPISENTMVVTAITPVDLNTAINPGDYVSLEKYKHCAIVVSAGVGTAASDIAITLFQAQDNAGTGVKALNCLVTKRVAVKEAVSLAAVGTYTVPTIATATNAYSSLTSGESTCLYVIDINADDLDVDNGFTHINLSIAKVGASKIGGANYHLSQARYMGNAETLKSAIA